LTEFELKLNGYFPRFAKLEHTYRLWILNLFNDNATEQAGSSLEIKGRLTEFPTDSVLKIQGMELQDAR
jgi:hypothetical protein